MNKIAFIFLIYNVINHEDIWYNFFKNIPGKNKILFDDVLKKTMDLLS